MATRINIVRDDGEAAKIGLMVGDLIISIDGKSIFAPNDCNVALQNAPCAIEVIRGYSVLTFRANTTSLGVVLGDVEFDRSAWDATRDMMRIKLCTAQSIGPDTQYDMIDVIGAEYVQGINVIADMAAGIREFTGGRSATLQAVIAEARKALNEDLRKSAYAVKANAVIAVAYSFTEIGDKGGYMLMATASGTAIKTK
jgi:uncharacterized protein YbjQ (UPF0145 family)